MLSGRPITIRSGACAAHIRLTATRASPGLDTCAVSRDDASKPVGSLKANPTRFSPKSTAIMRPMITFPSHPSHRDHIHIPVQWHPLRAETDDGAVAGLGSPPRQRSKRRRIGFPNHGRFLDLYRPQSSVV